MMFTDANIGAEKGTELLYALGLDAWEIQKPEVFRKYLVVAEYLERFSDAAMVARTVGRTALKNERLDKILEYVSLRKQLDKVRAEKAQLPQNAMIKDESPELIQKREEVLARESSLLNEIGVYER